MVSAIEHAESSDEVAGCGLCRHSVDLPGMEQIVCLAHLAVFPAEQAVACDEFERKRRTTHASARV